MNKLQLYISRSSGTGGFKNVRNFNPHQGVQACLTDSLAAIETIDYDTAEKYLFYLLSYIDGGAFLTILRTIPQRGSDHLACTVFVPSGIVVSRDEMAEVVRRTSRIVSNPSVSDADMADLHEIFSKEYPVEPDAPATDTSHGQRYAVWMYGGETGHSIDELFGQHLYQPYFAQYAGVLLIDSELGVYSSATDISDLPVERTVALLAPQPSDSGFAPYIYGRPFNRSFLVPLGRETGIVWQRNGYQSRTQTVVATRDGQRPDPIDAADSSRTLTPESFMISVQGSNKPVADAEITVNGTPLTGPVSMELGSLQSADVLITAPGFMPYRATINLAAQSTVLVKMHSSRKIYSFVLPVKSSELGSPIHFEIHTKRELTDSPVEGYELLDKIKEGKANTNYLSYSQQRSTSSWRPYLTGAVLGLVAGLAAGLLVKCGGHSDTATASTDSLATEHTEQVATAQTADAAPAAKPDKKPAAAASKAAIAYLDNNKSWSKSELDKHPELKGLFEDMNNFRLARIVDTWGPQLAASKRFGLVAQHARESLNKKIFKPEGTYCSAGDYTISVLTYLNRIDPSAKKQQ